MTLTTMYPAKINSPATTTTANIIATDLSIAVVELSVFPAAPNTATLWTPGQEDDAETVLYTVKSAAAGAGTLTIPAVSPNGRGFQGTAKVWGIGTHIARNLTAYDIDTLETNIGEVIEKTTNVEAIDEAGAATGDIVVFDLVAKTLKTAFKSITTVLGLDNTTVPTSLAVKTALALKSNIADPTFTGTVTIPTAIITTISGVTAAPTAAADTDTTQLATTQFVLNQASDDVAHMDAVAAAGTSEKYSRHDHVHPSDTTKVGVASPTFTGTATTPVLKVTTGAAAGNLLVSGADGTLGYLAAGTSSQVLVGAGAANPIWTAATGTGAPVRAVSPALTGNPTAPTPVIGDNDTSIATTAFVQAAMLAASGSYPAYASIVYQDGTNTYAFDHTGTLLSQVLSAAHTDNIPIQAAIDYAHNGADTFGETLGTVFIAAGYYYTAAKLVLGYGVKVLCEDSSGTVIQFGNIDFCEMHSASEWSGGFIRAYMAGGSGAYTSTVFLLDANAAVDAGEGADGLRCNYSRPIRINNAMIRIISMDGTYGGKGIWLKCEQADAVVTGLYGCEFSDITISGDAEYAIYMSTLGAVANRETITWNKFYNIHIFGTQHAIRTYCAGANNQIGLNYFMNITYQRDSVKTPGICVQIDGWRNTFYNMYIMDWLAAGDYTIYLSGAACTKNVFLNTGIEYISTLYDAGTDNTILLEPLPMVSRPITLTPKSCENVSTNPAVVATTEMATNIFPISYNTFTVAGRDTERSCWISYIEENWEKTWTQPVEGYVYTATGDSDGTHIHFTSASASSAADYYNGWTVYNVRTGISGVVSDYVSGVLTVATAGTIPTDTFYIRHPNMGMFTAQVEWTTSAADSGKSYIWEIYALRVPDTETYTTALPLVATLTDTQGTAGWVKRLTSTSSPFIITGKGRTVLWEVKLKSTGTGTLPGLLLGIKVLYKVGKSGN